MKSVIALAFVCGAFAGSFEPAVVQQAMGASEPDRILETAPGVRKSYTFNEMLALKRDGVTFMDVTDFPLEFGSLNVAADVNYPSKVYYKEMIQELSGNLSKAELESTLTKLTSFYTRYCKSETGLESSLWLRDQVADIVSQSARDDIDIELVDHDWPQKSLVARFRGSKTTDTVVVGAHQDSINLLLPNILPAPGADDDGSGTVTTLEVFRVLAYSGYEPENTVEFHWYSAEEVGLWGSQDIFERYSKEDRVVKAMLQQDMTGYSAGNFESLGHDALSVITDFVDERLTNYIKLLIDNYCDIPYVESTCGYACSDHASASKFGYPSAFVIESALDTSDKYIHSINDKIEHLSFDHMLQHAKLTLSYAFELGFASFD
ncbi:Leucine aminopeptidase 1 [Wickerhamiella sorbophila]|uniref:Peptide hydrolase n=1 Tax=Wickerhamiella sorbophila TaxID=45607 RepID=A0A2T0FF24_9ASCO|nr:Leucine aminopeptidase 1 [Wickerhamiella sorbophila]PRT53569.1 Leucine aminopeptidase 1 [Wickerhamiella sorbophila]